MDLPPPPLGGHPATGSSPKRLSLDERLEKELGIKVGKVLSCTLISLQFVFFVLDQVREAEQLAAQQHHLARGPPGAGGDQRPPDMSRPPPGYPPTGGMLPPPQSGQPPPQHEGEGEFHQPPPPPQAPSSSAAAVAPDKPEEGRLVRIGNMLQIVPDEPKAKSPSAAIVTEVPPVPAPLAEQEKQQQDSPAQSQLMKRLEEMKAKNQQKALERKRKREERIAKMQMQVLDGRATSPFPHSQEKSVSLATLSLL